MDGSGRGRRGKLWEGREGKARMVRMEPIFTITDNVSLTQVQKICEKKVNFCIKLLAYLIVLCANLLCIKFQNSNEESLGLVTETKNYSNCQKRFENCRYSQQNLKFFESTEVLRYKRSSQNMISRCETKVLSRFLSVHNNYTLSVKPTEPARCDSGSTSCELIFYKLLDTLTRWSRLWSSRSRADTWDGLR